MNSNVLGHAPIDIALRTGSWAMVTDQQQTLDALTCEICNAHHDGGTARGVWLREADGDAPWLLWVLPDGWSLAEHSDIAVCPEHQADPVLRTIRFNS